MRRRELNIRRMLLPAVLLPTIAALAACGGDSDSPSGKEEVPTSLTYSYPIDQQMEVPTPAPVVLRFSDSVEELGLEGSIVLRSSDGEVSTEARYADKGQSLILTPMEKLGYHSDYVIDFADDFPIDVEDITFSTKAAEEGVRADVISDEDMKLVRILPSDGEFDPMMDFSTLRLQFTQPIDRETVSYGIDSDDTVALIDENEDPVPAWVVVDGPYLSIDPKEDLTAGHQYQIRFKAGVERGEVASIYGESFVFQQAPRFAVDPSSSLAEGVEPDERPLPLVQYITTPEDQIDDDEVADGDDEQENKGNSPLTGKPVNEIPVNAVLLGDEDTTDMATTQQEGTVLGDLAFLPDWPRVSPLRIRRGTLLTGKNIDVKIGGEVEAGFDSGQVRVHFLSDATGYLIPNIYDPDGPRMLRLFMDVALSTEDPTANGGVTQDITHLELIGTVTTDTDEGVIDINAVGVVEPMILGQERGYGTLSFQLQTDRDQTEELVEEVRQDNEDLTPPELQSWTLGTDTVTGGDKTLIAKPGDPIILNFDEPIERQSVEGSITLYRNNTEIPRSDLDVSVDGTAVVIRIKSEVEESEYGRTARSFLMLDYDGATADRNQYRVQVGNGLTDLVGNSVTPFDQSFTLATRVSGQTVQDAYLEVGSAMSQVNWNFTRTERGPIILATYPGFPCALRQEFLEDLGEGANDSSRDLEDDKQGVCAGAFPGVEGEKAYDQQPMDDVLPVVSIPNNHPIMVSFNKAINPETVILGRTFKVEESINGEWAPVEGALKVEPRNITFWPSKPWEENRTLYRYTLSSAGYVICEVDDPGSPVYGAMKIGSISSVCVSNAESDATSFKLKYTVPFNCANPNASVESSTDSICDVDGLPLQTNPLGIVSVIGPAPSPLSPLSDYTRVVKGVAPDAGGPDFVQFFRAQPAVNTVLQRLDTQPISDTNNNFFNDRDKMNVSPDPQYTSGLADFPDGAEEYGADSSALLQPTDLGYDPDYDPDGLMLPMNSAKVLSRNQVPELGADIFFLALAKGIVTGCSWQFDSEDEWDWDSPMTCPERKFTYLNSSLVAEVTDEVTDQGIKVKIWPALIAGTSVDIYSNVNDSSPVAGDTGPQYLRMRFAGEDRAEAVVGYITEGETGPALLVNDLELYVDVPHATDWGVGSETTDVNMRSYPITMDLQGQIQFLDDGRMSVEQWNLNPVDITLKIGGGSAGYGALFIPEHGSRLNYLSTPIK